MNPKTGNRIAGCIIGGIVLFIVLIIVIGVSGSKDKADKVATPQTSTATVEQKTAEPAKTETPKPPEPTPTQTEGVKEAMKNWPDLTLNCIGGDNQVILADEPTNYIGGAREKFRVPCGTTAFAENKFYNEKLKITFYDVTINDKGAQKGYGWVIENSITWR